MDYREIEALSAVLELQSFEEAAKRLHVTQSAISQRIKALEAHYGEPVLVRSLPYKPTKLGSLLMGHFQQIRILEGSLKEQIEKTSERPRMAIALNRDSLETWFHDVLADTPLFGSTLLEIFADDQELTLDYLKKGLVSACVSTSSKEIVGGKAAFLGDMEYVLAASPSFAKGLDLLKGPAVKFDKNDFLHERYLENCFGLDGQDIPFLIVPSVRGFKEVIKRGYAYGLIPKIDILSELKKKELVQLHPDKVWKIPLYWHYWAVESKWYQQFNTRFIGLAQKKLAV